MRLFLTQERPKKTVHSFTAASPVCSTAGCHLHPDSFSQAAQSCLVTSPLGAPSLGLLHPPCGHAVLTGTAPSTVPCSLTPCAGAEGQGGVGVTGQLSAALDMFRAIARNGEENGFAAQNRAPSKGQV